MYPSYSSAVSISFIDYKGLWYCETFAVILAAIDWVFTMFPKGRSKSKWAEIDKSTLRFHSGKMKFFKLKVEVDWNRQLWSQNILLDPCLLWKEKVEVVMHIWLHVCPFCHLSSTYNSGYHILTQCFKKVFLCNPQESLPIYGYLGLPEDRCQWVCLEFPYCISNSLLSRLSRRALIILSKWKWEYKIS